jgi:hypothetical protein
MHTRATERRAQRAHDRRASLQLLREKRVAAQSYSR